MLSCHQIDDIVKTKRNKMKKIVALVAVLFSVVVPVQSQAADSKSLVIIDSYFQSTIAQNPITPSGTACPQVKPVIGATPSSNYNHGTGMYAVAKLQNPDIKIIPVCAASSVNDVTPAMFISALSWANNNSAQISAVSFSRYFNHATKPCMPTASSPWTPDTADKEIRRLIVSLKSKGIPVFASSGNSNNKAVTYPGCIAEISAVAHVNELGSPLAWSDANTDYFVKVSDDGANSNYSTVFGLVGHSSSSATVSAAAMWLTNNALPKLIKAKS
jgi:hypothetical protein